MIRNFCASLLLIGVVAATRAAEAPIRVLIVDGYSNHDWKLTTALIRGIIEPTGRFAVSVSTAPATQDAPGWDTWRPKFSDYDVVIQTCNDINGGPTWPRAVQEDFETFVRHGGGVYVWHGGNNAFPDWPAYNDMIGLGWRKKDFGVALRIDAPGQIVIIPAGEELDTSHGDRVDTVVHRLGDHPIHAGLPRAWLTPDIEVYHHARGPAKNLTVLSYGFDPRTQQNWPLEWIVQYDQGRVYTSTFGHVWKGDVQPERMRCAGLHTVVIRSLQWLAGRPVTWPVPADFSYRRKILGPPRAPAAGRFHPHPMNIRLLLAAAGGFAATALHAQRPEDQPLPPPPAAAVSFAFNFTPGTAGASGTVVAAQETYSETKGYGFDLDTQPGTNTPYFFSVKVPEGNYRITATFGDPAAATDTTVRTESAHLMAVDIRTAAGEFTTRTFHANVRRPQLQPPPPPNAPGGTRVHMFLAGEAEARHWDEKLTLEFNGPRPRVAWITIEKDDRVPTLFVAGDSTVGDPRRGPGGNWPTQLCQFLKPGIALCNSAEGGETSKSFLTGQRLDKVLSQMKAGDFFLIQFAHNDSKPQWPQSYTEPATTFKAYLGVYLAETRRRGATLVLVTPMERRSNGDTVGPWARAMREFAAEHQVPLIDQWAMSKTMWTALGPDVGSAFADQTHLNGYGGYLLARNIVRGIQENVPALAKFIVDDYRAMDPAHPDVPPAYLQQSPGPGGRAPTPPEPSGKPAPKP